VRWLTRFSHFSHSSSSERGASAVLLALLMVPLMGVLAISLDVSALYVERSQLQNGADAAALAIAQSCAGASTPAECTSSAAVLAGTFASANANDKTAGVLTPVFSTASSVTVTAVTREPDGTTAIRHPFAAFLGIDATTVTAAATAEWGSPRVGTVALPLTISYCEFRPALDGTLQLVRYDENTSCHSPHSGNPVIPGGFGWLDHVTGQCSLVIDLDQPWVSSDPGNSVPGDCDSTFNTMANTTVLVPIFDQVTGTGVNGSYRVLAFAAFAITGWKFSGSTATTDANAPPCTGNCRGIQGRFVRWVSLEDAAIAEASPNLGVVVVALSN
jgi:Flp pilus assembly protein TadG